MRTEELHLTRNLEQVENTYFNIDLSSCFTASATALTKQVKDISASGVEIRILNLSGYFFNCAAGRFFYRTLRGVSRLA